MRYRYVIGAAAIIPFLPLLYVQSKWVRARTPVLPEADGCAGRCRKESGQTISVMFTGESTVAGVGVSTHDEGIAGTFAKELSRLLNADVDWEVHAKSGFTAKKVADEIVPGLPEKHVDLVVVGLGANDAFSFNSPWKWRRHVDELIVGLRKHYGDVPIVFSQVPPIKEFPGLTRLIKFFTGNLVELLGHELQLVARDHEGVYALPGKMTMENWLGKTGMGAVEKAHFFSDGVHPSKLTYQLIAEELAEYAVSQGVLDVERGEG